MVDSSNACPAERPRVLVVDDEEDTRDTVRFYLERAGFDVKEAANGYEALGAARAWHPDVVLLDVMMPHENGYRVSRFLKDDIAAGSLPPMTVVLVTARKLEGEHEETVASRSQSDHVLYKPFDLDELLALVESCTAVPAAPGWP